MASLSVTKTKSDFWPLKATCFRSLKLEVNTDSQTSFTGCSTPAGISEYFRQNKSKTCKIKLISRFVK